MAAPYPQLVLFGDSLMQQSVDVQDAFSFQAALQSRKILPLQQFSSLPKRSMVHVTPLTKDCPGFIRRLDVVNRGFSGWNTANAIKYLTDIFPEPTPSGPKLKYLVVLFGANDAVLPLPTSSQHVPIERYKENLTKIITHPHIKQHNAKVLLVVPPPVDEIKLAKLNVAEGHASALRKSATSAAYSEKAREVARENPGVVLIDLWKAVMDKAIAMTAQDYKPEGPWLGSPENGKQGGLDSLLPDGLHLSRDAYRLLYDQIEGHIGEEWRGLSEQDCTGYLYPDWKVLNPVGL
ncbi:hypothetical protein E4U42_007870 [Claviceps africana]|uniref:SGNH hydrolase-type esterase domain-containing protein n=1 Tax=Claviceps africana TaxID=83212 RepID=A0A8K0J0H1_9HYPO|nr:hypothetical protein E4U42_007870 [Claviceps africana]